ncbi:LysR family transcriptional regulator [Pseudoalteromonas sp. MSK9-3]|uniref:LysR family transcriptional regulator n=1 Tax=Pseudoalteromonas sp. MSK9-3 TaxID=1897633 RepID=UPI000E6C600C|nr:LysR family transcriptional regulator [Pseudoalteromonas sp. MSK9-3]
MQRTIDLIKAMRIFLTVVEAHSFSGASGKLNLATSAVSKQVSDLEAYYGCKLLLRSTRTMHLTAEGERFVIEFKTILSQLSVLKDSVQSRKEQVVGRLKITSPENARGLMIDEKIARFMAAYPHVKVCWQQLNDQVNVIDEGVDVAIRIGALADSTLVAQRFAQQEVLMVASPQFLKQHGTPVHPKDLTKLPCIIEVSNRQPWRWRYCEGGEVHTVTVTGDLELNNGETVAYFAAQGHGVARLPRFMMKSFLDSGQLVPILTEFITPPLEVSLVYAQARLTNPALNAFIHFIKHSASD